MSKNQPEPTGFQPIEVHPFVDKSWQPIEVPVPSSTAPVVVNEKPATGTKEER